RVRIASQRRRRHESRAARKKGTVPLPQRDSPLFSGDPLAAITGRELSECLDTELQRLPERLRAPLVLCCLEGQTRDEAARQLGWSLATLKRRLERGRALLRARLERRGFELPAALAGVLVAEGVGRAMVPAALAQSVVRAATNAVATSPRVWALTHRFGHGAFLSPLRVAAVLIVAV